MTINIDLNTITATNKLSFGIQTDYYDASHLVNKQEVRDHLKTFKCRMVRFFIYRSSGLMPSEGKGPCRSWNSTTHTGVFDWSGMDRIIDTILDIGAEPFPVIFHFGSTRFPLGMYIDPTTNLPDPLDAGEYVRVIVNRYKGKVKFWDTLNEPQHYVNWTSNPENLPPICALHDAMYKAMKEEDPSCYVSHDAMGTVLFNNYFDANGLDYDFINYHSYGGYKEFYADPDPHSDSDILDTRIRYSIFGSSTMLGLALAREKFRNRYGHESPIVVNGETNWNSCWQYGADPKNIQTQQQVYAAMQVIWSIPLGLTHRIHFNTTANISPKTQPDGTVINTYGFGLMTSTAIPKYPLLFYQMVGSNLDLDDSLYQTSSDQSTIYAMTWMNGEKIHILLANKKDTPVTVPINGIIGNATIQYITPRVDYLTPAIQTDTIILPGSLSMDEMSVYMLSLDIEGDDIMSFKYTNGDNEIAIYRFVIKEMVETIIAERTVEVQIGETVTLTVEPGEEVIRVE